uniref:RING-type domain-containing protein n=1 Tax=Macrostomum lignano TaxID=282301 RepID=A0A1I8F8M7_9PLAT
ASVSASDCHWNGADGVSGVDLSAISQQGGSCPIRLALAQARIAAAGSVGSSCGSSTGQYRRGTSGGRWRDFRSDTRLYWECLAARPTAKATAAAALVLMASTAAAAELVGAAATPPRPNVDESWSFSRSDLSSSAGSYGLELPDSRGGAVESGARISCDSLEGGRHPHPGGSAAQEAVSSDHSLLLVDRADRHLYWQHRSDLHPEAAATAFDSTDGAAAASNMPTVGEEDQSGLDESSLSSVANEQLDVDQLWDYSCQPDLYSDADDTDELDEQRTQAALLLEDSQLSCGRLTSLAMDLTSAGCCCLSRPPLLSGGGKLRLSCFETEQDFLVSTHPAADMAAGVERLDGWPTTFGAGWRQPRRELEKLRQAEGESRQRRLLMENWELLIGWLQSDLDTVNQNRESLSRARRLHAGAGAAALPLRAPHPGRSCTDCRQLERQPKTRTRRPPLSAAASALLDGSLGASLTASAHARIDETTRVGVQQLGEAAPSLPTPPPFG